MKLYFISAVIILAAAYQRGQVMATDEPMVAFVCNRPAMHSTDRGWVRDDNTNCITDPVDILNYCRKVYPHLDVWNVVEASEMVTIRNWCNFGHIKCRHRFTVRPYRCLVGAFQSEALQVPEHCQFDHVHDAAECKSYDAWNKTTAEACSARQGSWLHGFAVLQPCGIDGFNGAEFVCCPSLQPIPREHVKTTTVTTRRQTTTEVTSSVAVHTTTSEEPMAPVDDLDDVTEAVDSGAVTDVNFSEHDRFMKAKEELERRHHDKVAKMMKDWAAARRRVQEIKKVDVKGGEKFNREMTARFQKAYESLEHEASVERKKLMSTHRQRVQDELSRRKTYAMDAYLAALSDSEPDASKILTALMQYIKAEQKDRIHTINHYEHVEESEPVEAESLRATVAAHLRGIDERVTQAVDMLARLPKYEKKIRSEIEKLLSRYQSLDESLAVIMAKINEKSNRQTQDHTTTATTADFRTTQDTLKEESTSGMDTSPVAGTGTESEAQTSEKSGVVVLPTTTTAETVSVESGTTFRDSLHHHFVEMKQVVQHASHQDKNDLVVLESYIQKLPTRLDSGSHLAAPIAIVVCGIAVFVVIVGGIAMLRRRTTTGVSERSVTEIDRSTSGKMTSSKATGTQVPINGYENPTYQYYTAAAAAGKA